MRQHTSLFGPKQKWVNYKTGVKSIYFRLDADKRGASVAIEMQDNDPGINALYFEQFETLQNYLEAESGSAWIWEKEAEGEYGKSISRIYQSIEGVSLYNKLDWGTIFAFFESCIVPLDSVWADCSDVFKDLAN